MTNMAELRTANDRLKARANEVIATSLIAAALVHFAVFTFFPELTAPDWTRAPDEVVSIIPIDEIPIPKAPTALTRPATPIGAVDVPVEATLPVIGFDGAAKLPPPPPPDAVTDTRGASGFAVYTVAPMLLDPDRFQRELVRVYPRELRDAGVGGRVELLISIDAQGRVTGATVGASSGYTRLDEAALALADGMRFSPAMNRDKRVAVTVSIPIEFQVRN